MRVFPGAPRSSRIYLAAALMCCVAAEPAFALDPSKSVYQYNCKSWTREDGLPANGINSIVQTPDGYLWLGTQKGLVAFDGIEFALHTPPDTEFFRNQIVATLTPAKAGGLWFSVRDGAFGSFTPAGGFADPPANPGVVPTMVTLSLYEAPDGIVWVGGNTGLISWNPAIPGSGKMDTNVPNAWTIYEDSSHRIWFGTVESGLFWSKDGVFSKAPDPDLNSRGIRSLAEDGAGGLWVGTTHGLLHYDSQFQKLPAPEIGDEVRALLLDRNGVLWIGTTGDGLGRLKNGQMVMLSTTEGLANPNVTALFEDREGTLWIGTRSGLSQLTDVKLAIYSEADGILGRGCHEVCAAAGGGIWGAMTMGLSRLHGSEITNYSLDAGLSLAYTKMVFEARDGDVYLVHGNKDIEILSDGVVVARHQSSTWPTGLAQDNQGVIAAIGDRLFRVSRTELVPYDIGTNQPLPLYWVRNLQACTDGALLISSVNGLFRIEGGRMDRWSTEQGLPNLDVHCAFEDIDGSLWVGTAVGMARIRGNKAVPISRRNGLYDNYIYSIVPDDYGAFWVNSSRGIFQVLRRDLNDFADGKTPRVACTVFDSQADVKALDTTEVEYSGCKSSDGRIWFPSPEGMIMINPTNLCRNPIPPPVQIQQVRANDSNLLEKGDRQLKPGRGSIEVRYTAPSFIAPKNVRFRYRLVGYEPDWVDAGSRRSAFYTNLKPGAYRFEVQARNSDGVWSTDSATFDIVLPPHFYQSTWFLLLMAGVGILALLGIYAWRVKHLTWKQKKLQEAHDILEAKVEERTHELKNEIEERKRMEFEVERVHRELVDASRVAGQAEVAASVLHNVGNVLNSVNVSTNLLTEKVRHSKTSGVSQMAELFSKNLEHLPEFLAAEGRSAQITGYLQSLSSHLQSEQAGMLEELTTLTGHIEHINRIVAMQQDYAKAAQVIQIESVPALVKDALRTQANKLEANRVRIISNFEPVPDIPIDKHKVLQILVNLIANANQAMSGATGERILTLDVRKHGESHVRIGVADTGTGMPREQLDQIFTHGAESPGRRRGFGLHTGSLSARQMGGNLQAHSEGAGKGSTFTLDLPLNPPGDSRS
ncbi:MAG: two-component regulator propeller domain-containing protein [Verrucomicrobiota bacterium]